MSDKFKKQNLLIAITGGIGSGKTTALSILNSLGYFTISCDKITADLYKKRAIKKIIKGLFPTAVSGKLFLKVDKKEISKIVFNDKILNDKLTDTLTPIIFNESIKIASRQKGIVFVEVPLLFEKNYVDKFDKVIVITREKQAKIQSVMARSNLTEQEVLSRISMQVDYDNLDMGDYIVIDNNGDLEQLKGRLIKAVHTILEK